jgi:GxxExxY protein
MGWMGSVGESTGSNEGNTEGEWKWERPGVLEVSHFHSPSLFLILFLARGLFGRAESHRFDGFAVLASTWAVIERRSHLRNGIVIEADTKRVNRQGAKDARREPGWVVDALARVVVDAALEVHRVLGPGFLESVYEQALAVELGIRGVAFARQVPVGLHYKGESIGEGRLDLLVGGRLVVELKAVEQLSPIHFAQVISYLKATGHPLGLLITFNVPQLRRGIRRVVLSPNLLGGLGALAVHSPGLSTSDAPLPTVPKVALNPADESRISDRNRPSRG